MNNHIQNLRMRLVDAKCFSAPEPIISTDGDGNSICVSDRISRLRKHIPTTISGGSKPIDVPINLKAVVTLQSDASPRISKLIRRSNPVSSRHYYYMRLRKNNKRFLANNGKHNTCDSRRFAMKTMLRLVTNNSESSESDDSCTFQCANNNPIDRSLGGKAVTQLFENISADIYDRVDILSPSAALERIYVSLSKLLWHNDNDTDESNVVTFDSYVSLEDDVVSTLSDIHHFHNSLDVTICEIHQTIRSYRYETERSILREALSRILKRVYQQEALTKSTIIVPDHFSKGATILSDVVATTVIELCYDPFYDTSSACSLNYNVLDDIPSFQSGMMSSLLGTSQLSGDVKMVGERVTHTLDKCDSLVDTMEELINKVHAIPVLDDNFDLIEYLKRRLCVDLSQGESFLLDSALVVLILSGAYTVYRYPTLINKTFLITLSGAFCIRHGYAIGTKLSTLVVKWTTVCGQLSKTLSDEIAHFESGVDISVFQSIITLLTTFLEIRNVVSVDGIMSAIRRIPKTTDSVSTMIESFKFFIYWLQSNLSSLTGGFIPSPLNPTGDVEAEDFTRNAINLQESFSTGHLLMTKGTTTIVMHQIKLGEQILMRLTRVRKPVLASYVTRHIVGLRKILDNIAKFTLNRSVVRPEPAVLLLVGGPGTGKSVAMRMIETSLMRDITTDNEYAEYCNNNSLYSFHRMKPSYWEGVTRQCKAIIYDDFMQVREIAGGESTACEFIKLVNTAPFVPDMAFGDKGSIFLEPRFVIATTNMSNMHSEAIIDRGALTRRMHIRVQVSIKPEFAINGKVDSEKVPTIRSDIYTFRQFDYADNGSIILHGPSLTLEDVSRMVKQKMDANLSFSESLSTACIDFASGLEEDLTDIDPLESFNNFMDNYVNMDIIQMESIDSTLPVDFISSVSKTVIDQYGIELNNTSLTELIASVLGQRVLQVCPKDYGTVAKHLVRAGSSFFKIDVDPTVFQVCDHSTEIEKVVSNPWKRALQFINNKWFAGSVLGTTILAGLYYSYNTTDPVDNVITDEPTVEYGKKVEYAFKRGAKAAYQKPIKFVQTQDTHPNSGPSFQTGEGFGNSDSHDLVAKYTKNLYEVTHDSKHFGWSLVLSGGMFMMPYHFCTSICSVVDGSGLSQDYTKTFTFTNVITSVSYTKTVGDIVSTGYLVPERDVICFEIKCKPHVDLVNNFVSKEAFTRFSRTISRKENGFLFTERGVFNFDNATYAKSLSAYLDGGLLKVDDVIRYSCSSMAGDCGMPLVFNYKDGHKIVGVHFAGSKAHGFSVVLTREFLIGLLKREPLNNFKLIDSVFPQTSTFVKSSITTVQHGMVPYRDTSVTTPTHSEANYIKELAKYKRPSVTADMELVKICATSYYDSIMMRSSNSTERRVYEIDEAIFGIVGDPSFGPLDRSTSMGWPFSGRKSVVMGLDRKLKEGSEYVIDRITEMISLYVDGCRPFVAYGDFTKDEKLPKHKVEAGKIRLISGSPFDYLVVTRMFFGAFTHHVMKYGLDFGMAITVNPYSDDWSSMSNAMVEKSGSYDSKFFGAGDFKGFDKSQVREIMYIVLSIIERWYGDTDPVANKVRALIFEDITDSIHIRGSKVYYWHTSLPSGNPLTTILNSLYNHVSMRYCWLRLHDNDLSSLMHFDDNIQLYVVGDDHVFATTPSVANVYNEANLVPYMAELGLTYTSDLKSDDVHVGLRYLKDVTFLKRKFIPDDIIGRVLAPLDLTVVTEIPLWTKNGDINIACDNASTAMRELSLHPEEVFDCWSSKIINMYDGVWVPESTDYRTVQSNVLTLIRP